MKKEVFYLNQESYHLVKWFTFPAGRRTAGPELINLIEKYYYLN